MHQSVKSTHLVLVMCRPQSPFLMGELCSTYRTLPLGSGESHQILTTDNTFSSKKRDFDTLTAHNDSNQTIHSFEVSWFYMHREAIILEPKGTLREVL